MLYLVEKYDEENVNNNSVFKLISILVNQGCSINAYDPEIKITAFHSAIMLAENTLLVKFLLENGADINIPIMREKSKGKNAVEWAETLLEIKEEKKQSINTIKDIILLLNENHRNN